MDKRRDIEKLWYFDTEEDFSGRSLSLSRKVDLKSYNDYETIGKSPDWIDWSDSESLEFDFVVKRILKIYADRFILQASEYGIRRYERILGIEPGKNESLEERRKRVYLLWNKKIRWTHRTLLKWLDVAVGNESYDVKLYYNDYGIEFRIFMDKGRVDHDYLIRNLRQIIPANLGIIWTLVYRQNIYVGMYPMSLIKKTYHPYYPGDIRVNFSIFVGICQSYIKKKRTYKLPDVMIYDYDNFIETTLERGEKINYDRD
ncbi:DUF2313 domain-containing protein [Peptoniphilus harei]|uniref:putative phage tail protein n=1 Tax=Peptoniphilus harei TaxID=54005 RepID=UPI00254E710F|nr:putative phage tail protein [Peptoniphilus harei]MDK7354972.1 DUF2313 domain-containing protein [Peptoniphilus harei]MDK7370626.1 DUF2313 domain-containing protein [Peptoniphilus harei]